MALMDEARGTLGGVCGSVAFAAEPFFDVSFRKAFHVYSRDTSSRGRRRELIGLRDGQTI